MAVQLMIAVFPVKIIGGHIILCLEENAGQSHFLYFLFDPFYKAGPDPAFLFFRADKEFFYIILCPGIPVLDMPHGHRDQASGVK